MSHPIHTRLQRILGNKIFTHDVQITGRVGIARAVSSAGILTVRTGADENFTVDSASGIRIGSQNDAFSLWTPLTIAGSSIKLHGGPITLSGDSRVYKHLWVSVTTFRPSGAQLGNQGINTHLIFRDNFDDIAFYDGHVPYERQIGTDMDVELIWYYTGGNQAGNCLWNVTYDSVAHEGGDPTGAGTALTQQAVNIATDDTTGHLHFTVPGATMDDHDNMFLKVWRNGNDDLDTLGTNALLLGAHLHFLTDKIGEAV